MGVCRFVLGMFRSPERVTFSSSRKSPHSAQEPPTAVGLVSARLRTGEAPPRGKPLGYPRFTGVPNDPRTFICGTKFARHTAFAPLARYKVLKCKTMPLIWSAL